MNLKEITLFEFDEFAKNHPLNNYYQTSNYAILMAEEGYSYDFIGYYNNNEMIAGGLILYKKIDFNLYFGYCPKGFLIDYSDEILLKSFTEDLKKYYQKKHFVYIKINPEIAIGEVKQVDHDIYECTYNNNIKLISNLTNNGYKHIREENILDYILPKYNGLISLNNLDINRMPKNIRNKVRKAYKKGLNLEKVSFDKIPQFYKFIKSMKNIPSEKYFKNLYNIFTKNDSIDLFLVKINYETYLLNAQKDYEDATAKSNKLNNIIQKNPTQTNINKKMDLDRTIANIKENIIKATNGAKNMDIESYIAGAFIIKQGSRIYFAFTGYDYNYRNLNPNYFLYYDILKYYKNEYKIADLNGLKGYFGTTNPYYKSNKFKISFNAKVYEFIGEFDLIINDKKYHSLQRNGKLKKEFKN